MGVSEFLSSVKKKDVILKNYFSISEFLMTITNYFIDSDSVLEIEVFRCYLSKYDSYINCSVLSCLDTLYQRSKRTNNCNFLFINDIFEKHGYISNDNDAEAIIDRLFFVDRSPACFDLVVRSKKVCKFTYRDGQALIDKVILYFERSICENGDIYFYRKLIFTMLSSNFYKNSVKFDDIVLKIRDVKKRKFSREIESLLISLTCFKEGLNDKNRKYLLNTYNIGINFSSKIGNVLAPVYSELEDMTDRRIITIDSGRKVIRDDAISIHRDGDNYVLTVYIADVSSFVPIDSILYKQAFEKGEALYTLDSKFHHIPMFPDRHRNFFSLDSNGIKYVIAHEFVFSSGFDFIRCDVKFAKINVGNNYSYDDLLRCRGNDYDMICLLEKLSSVLIKNFNVKTDSVGQKIVTSYNLFLNSYVANFFNKFNYPFIYLNTEKFSDTYVFDCYLREGFTSSYSVQSYGNVINDGAYGYVTKPIRNFSSFLNQYFERFYFLEWHGSEKNDFRIYWEDRLPLIVMALNRQVSLNKEFVNVVNKVNSKRLTKF